MNYDQIANESRASIEHEDLKVLLPLVASINPKNILEIGTWKGYSAETWIRAFNPKKFVTIEKDEYIVESNLNIQYFFNADSHNEIIYRAIEQKIPIVDFLFIDGDHSLEGVTKDWEMYSSLVRKGGLIALHDILHYNKEPEVNITPLWNELKKQYPYVEIKVGKNSTGIGVIYY